VQIPFWPVSVKVVVPLDRSPQRHNSSVCMMSIYRAIVARLHFFADHASTRTPRPIVCYTASKAAQNCSKATRQWHLQILRSRQYRDHSKTTYPTRLDSAHTPPLFWVVSTPVARNSRVAIRPTHFACRGERALDASGRAQTTASQFVILARRRQNPLSLQALGAGLLEEQRSRRQRAQGLHLLWCHPRSLELRPGIAPIWSNCQYSRCIAI